MLSSESIDTLENKASDSSLDIGSQSTLASSKPTSSITDVDDRNNNITSNVLSAFSSNRFQPHSNLFSSSINPPFDYNFSKNKKPSKYTSTLLNEGTSNASISTNNENKSTNNINKDKGKGNSVLTFTEFLKNNFSKANASTVATTSNDTASSSDPIQHDPIHQSSTSNNSTSPSKSNTKTTPKLSVITMKEDLKKKSKVNVISEKNNDMDVDKNTTTTAASTNTNTFDDIWLNPEVFAAPNDDQDVTMNAEISKLSTSSTPTNIEKDTTSTPKLLTNTINLSAESQPNEALYDRYINDNSNVLREKLQSNIKEELQKNGVTIHGKFIIFFFYKYVLLYNF